MADYAIKNPRCPECGQMADGTLEVMTGRARLEIDEATGEAFYEGGTDIFWDDQETKRDGRGRAILLCPEGHEWGMETDA